MKHELTGTAALFRLALRRDRLRIMWWIVGIGLYWVYVITAAPAAIDQEDLHDVGTSLLGGPMGRLLAGPTHGFESLTYDRFLVGSYGLYAMLLAALMSIFMVVRHTRAEEESGRGELIRANVVGRHATLTAAILITVLSNLLVSAAVFLISLTSPHLGASGSFLFGASICCVGIAFGGVAAIMSQLTAFAQSASALSGLILGLGFVLRALGDMTTAGGSAISWLSPLAWSQQTAPFVLNRWWPLLLSIGFGVLTFALGFVLSVQRDFGASLFQVRHGPSSAPTWLASMTSLSFRLQRTSIVVWLIAIASSGLLYGVWADALRSSVDELPDMIINVLGGHDDIVAAYLGFICLLSAFLGATFAIIAVQRLRTEEQTNRAELILASPTSRTAWLRSQYVVAVTAVLAMLLITGIITGLGAFIVTGNAEHVWNVTATQVSYFPPIALITAIAALTFGINPTFFIATWIYFGYTVFIGFFASLLDLPRIAVLVSPFEHVGILPLESFGFTAAVTMVLITIAVFLGALRAVEQRDIGL